MLQKTTRKTTPQKAARIAIVASVYNAEYVDSMIDAALETLAGSGVNDVELIRVPGAFEIPVVAAKLAQRKRLRPEAVLCLGVILRGKTTHAEHIGQSVTQSLAQIATDTTVPMVHEVLLLENKAQAKERCLSPKTNRGFEAAHTALIMAGLIREI
ncbi:MAG: 6,7-dimethyl-8-ribityllumazine synthase [Limisphaerales bacterium]